MFLSLRCEKYNNEIWVSRESVNKSILKQKNLITCMTIPQDDNKKTSGKRSCCLKGPPYLFPLPTLK